MNQIVRTFFNHQAFKNCACIYLEDENVTRHETIKNVTVLYKDDLIIGYNIIDDRFSKYKSGYVAMNEELLKIINDCLDKAHLTKLDADMENRLVVGKVVKCEDHPDSDHLHVCQVDIGSKTVQIVCGAANCKEGILAVVACDQAVMPDGKWIKAGQLRGVDSYGMMCSEYELGLIQEHKRGLYILDESYVVGEAFKGGKENV